MRSILIPKNRYQSNYTDDYSDNSASNSKWTHSLSYWKNYYKSWMDEPAPETVINFSTFFDCRHIYGDASLVDDLKSFLDEMLQQPLEKMFFFMDEKLRAMRVVCLQIEISK